MEKWEETSGGYLTTKKTNLIQGSEAFQIPERLKKVLDF